MSTDYRLLSGDGGLDVARQEKGYARVVLGHRGVNAELVLAGGGAVDRPGASLDGEIENIACVHGQLDRVLLLRGLEKRLVLHVERDIQNVICDRSLNPGSGCRVLRWFPIW